MREKTKVLDLKEVEVLGRQLADRCKAGTIIALTGDLGAGKTTLTKAIARGLGVKEEVTSPTFTIINEYKSGRLPLYHFDVYRLGDWEEMYQLGWEEYFYGDGVCIVEWADKVEELLPPEVLRVHLEYGAAENERVCRCIY